MIDKANRRASVVRAVRRFFENDDFIEVDTPIALSAIAPELHIDAPRVELSTPIGTTKRFLQSSPELPMKRLLAGGLDRIFQIAAVFRNGELGVMHRPEFRLLEWYRRGAGWASLLRDCEGLLQTCATAVTGSTAITYRGTEIAFDAPFRQITVDDAFRRWAGFSILDKLEHDALARQLDTIGVGFENNDSWDDLFHRVFLSRVEPELLRDPTPLFLTHYPAPLSALARLCPDDSRRSERFELFVAGIELANGFGELTDPVEQRRRFDRDRNLITEKQGNEFPLDERFLAALTDLPPSAGIALGFDRLLALLLDAPDIDDVSLIPWSES